jgi:hypothetical protein
MKVKTIVYIHHAQWAFEETGTFQVFSAKLDDTEYRTYVGEQEIEIDVPDDYDPRAQKIAALEEHKKKVMADYQKTLTELNTRISKLQAIEFTA